MTAKKDDADQVDDVPAEPVAVGYCRPPVEHRFQKGTSGNSRGRPRKLRQLTPPVLSSIDDLVRAEASRPLSFRENGIEVSLPAIQVGLRSAAHAAAKGSHRAQLMMTNLLAAGERRKREEQEAIWSLYVDFKQRWRDVCARCDRYGEPRPDPVPHPDEVVFDVSTGEIAFNGPSNQYQKNNLAIVMEFRGRFVKGIAWMKKQKSRRKTWSAQSEATLDGMQRAVDLIDHVLPRQEMRRTPGFNLRRWESQQPTFEKVMAQFFKLKPDWNQPQ